MSKDNRKKGCPNSNCQMNVQKIRQSVENDFCPKCATRLVFVCSKCFDEIEDIDKKHRICKKCEVLALEKRAKNKEIFKGAVAKGSKGLCMAGAVVFGTAVKAFTSEGGKQVRKHASDAGKKLAQTVFKSK